MENNYKTVMPVHIISTSFYKSVTIKESALFSNFIEQNEGKRLALYCSKLLRPYQLLIVIMNLYEGLNVKKKFKDKWHD